MKKKMYREIYNKPVEVKEVKAEEKPKRTRKKKGDKQMGIVEVLSICAFNVISFVIGAKVGQKIVRQEPIEVNPVKAVNKAVEEHKENKAKEAEDEYYKAIYQNIDNYSGDGLGQIDIPRRK